MKRIDEEIVKSFLEFLRQRGVWLCETAKLPVDRERALVRTFIDARRRSGA